MPSTRRPVPKAPRSALVLLSLLFIFSLLPLPSEAAKGGKDKVPPTLTVNSPADGSETGESSIPVTGRAGDDKSLSAVELSVNGGTARPLSLDGAGAFATDAALEPGANTIAVTARDGAGNSTRVTRSVLRLAAPSPIVITSPQDGDVIQGRFVDVIGTYGAPVANMGWMSLAGLAGDGAFTMSRYPVDEGESVIRAYGYDAGGTEYITEITVTGVGSDDPVALLADVPSGEAPLTVRFAIAVKTAEVPVLCEIDYRGDETYTPLADCSDGGEFIYENGRTYLPGIRMQTADGHQYSNFTQVSVHGPATYISEFPAADPVDMAIDGEGKLYILERTDGRVVVADGGGSTLLTFGANGNGNGYFTAPSSIALDADGRIYVADTGNHRVQYFAADGSFLGSWGRDGDKYGELSSPRGIAIDYNGDFVVAEAGNGRVERMRKEDGHWFNSVGESELTEPRDVLWAGGMDVAVIDRADGELKFFSPHGGRSTALAKKPGPFVAPAGLSLDRPNGYIVITDEGANSITLAASEGDSIETVRVITSLAGDPKYLSAPRAALRGIEEHEDIYYIADSGNNRIVKVRLESGPGEDPPAVWAEVRDALANDDTEGVLDHFSLQTKDRYRQVLTDVGSSLPQVVADMGELVPLRVSEQSAVYGVLRYDNDRPYLFEVHFVRDELGGWKILYW